MPQDAPYDSQSTSEPPSGGRLESWKEIAAYLNRGVTTVQRWELHEALPVHRHQHDTRDSVYAYKAELEAWRVARQRATGAANNKDQDVAHIRGRLPLVAITIGVCVVATSAIAWRVTVQSRSSIAISIPITATQVYPSEDLLEGPGPAFAVSPDLRHLVYAARRNGIDQLYLRKFEEPASTPLRGTERARAPFFSPDGQWVGFFADSQVKKVPLDGGEVRVVCAVSGNAAGGTWGSNDTIVFAGFGHGLKGVPASGGEPYEISLVDPAAGEVDHRWPEMLPGSAALVFTVWSGSLNNARIAVQPLKSSDHSTLLHGSQPRVLGTDRIAFVRGDGLWVASFDRARMTFIDSPVRLLAAVRPRHGGATDYATGGDGALAYSPSRLASRNIVEWVDRQGRSTPISAEGSHSSPRLSPDGKRLAVVERANDGASDVWVYDLVEGGRTRLPIGNGALDPVWTPRGDKITYSSSQNGPNSLYWVAADGTQKPELLLKGELGVYPLSWSPSEDVLAFHQESPSTGHDVWLLAPGKPSFPLLTSSFGEGKVRFSPDGNWLAYVSDKSGQNDVYVTSRGRGGKATRISKGGGDQPVWSRKGDVVFYRNLSGNILFQVSTRRIAEGNPDPAVVTLDGPYEIGTSGGATAADYDVAADGRFVMIKRTRDSVRQEVRLVLHWTALLEPVASGR